MKNQQEDDRYDIRKKDHLIGGCCSDGGISCMAVSCCGGGFIPAAVVSFRMKKFVACATIIAVFVVMEALHIWAIIDLPPMDAVLPEDDPWLKVHCRTHLEGTTCGDRYDELKREYETQQREILIKLVPFYVVAFVGSIFTIATLVSIRTIILRRRGENPEPCFEQWVVGYVCFLCLAAQMMRWTNGSHKIPGYNVNGNDEEEGECFVVAHASEVQLLSQSTVYASAIVEPEQQFTTAKLYQADVAHASAIVEPEQQCTTSKLYQDDVHSKGEQE